MVVLLFMGSIVSERGSTINKNPEGFLLIWLPLGVERGKDLPVHVNGTRLVLVPGRRRGPVHGRRDTPLLVRRVPHRSRRLDIVPVLVLGRHQPENLRRVDRFSSVGLGRIVGLRTLRLLGGLSRAHRVHLGVDLGVSVKHTLASQFVKPGNAHLHRFHAVAKDGERLAHALQAARGDDLVNPVLLVGGTDDLRPPHKVLCELLVNLAELLHLLGENLLLSRLGSIRLLVGEVETVKERFVENASTGETSVVVALTLRVRGRDDGEPISRMHELADLLDHHALTLKHGLKAHDLLRAEIDLVKEQHGTALQRNRDGTILPDGVAVNEAERTEQIALVGFGGDVDAEALTLQLGADLLHHRRLTVAGQTRDEHGREQPRTQDRLNRREVTPRNVGIDLVGDQRHALAAGHPEHGSTADDWGGTAHRLSNDRRRRSSSRREHHLLTLQFRHVEQATTRTAGGVLDDPRGRARHTALGGSGHEIRALHGRDRGDGGESGNERGLLGRESGSHSAPIVLDLGGRVNPLKRKQTAHVR